MKCFVLVNEETIIESKKRKVTMRIVFAILIFRNFVCVKSQVEKSIYLYTKEMSKRRD